MSATLESPIVVAGGSVEDWNEVDSNEEDVIVFDEDEAFSAEDVHNDDNKDKDYDGRSNEEIMTRPPPPSYPPPPPPPSSPTMGAESKFYEGDKAMYVPPTPSLCRGRDDGSDGGKDGTTLGPDESGADAAAGEAVKVRIFSVHPPYCTVALPDGTEAAVHFSLCRSVANGIVDGGGDGGGNGGGGGLYTVDEYEALMQQRRDAERWTYVPTASYGGSGGGPFDDHPDRRRHIVELSINAGALVDGLRVMYSDGSIVERGGTGGGWTSFSLVGGEYVVSATVRYGRFVQSLAFRTNKGRVLGPCGNGGFFLAMGRVSEITLDAPTRHMLVGLHGRKGKYIDAIGFHWSPVTAAAETVTKRDLSTELRKKLLKSSPDSYGGPGGKPFDDGHYNIRINEINIRVGKKSGHVKGITVWYFNGKVSSYGRKQSNDDDGEYLSLELGEYIDRIIVRFGPLSYVKGLEFRTTKGRELVCGDVTQITEGNNDDENGCAGIANTDENENNNNNATNATEVVVSKAPEGYMLVGIKGGSGTRLDRIGFHWGPIPNANIV